MLQILVCSLALFSANGNIASAPDWRVRAEDFLHRHAKKPAMPLGYVMKLKPKKASSSPLHPIRPGQGFGSQVGHGVVLHLDPSVASLIKDFMACTRRQDSYGLHALLAGIPSRFANAELDDYNLMRLVGVVSQIGEYAANIDNSPSEAMAYLANYPSDPADLMQDSYACIVAIQLGDRDPDLLDALSTEAKTSFFLPEIIPTYFPEGEMPSVADQPLFYAEILAAEDNSDQWLEEVHARRALAVYPNQAMSAMLLMPLLGATHRTEEAMQIGQMALRNSVGDGRSDIQGRINGILTIRSRGG